MEFTQALGLLNNATAENIVQQLFALNRSIQNADEKDILAIYFTLEGMSGSVKTENPAWGQIYQLKQSVEARMAFLITESSDPKKLYRGFNAAIGFSTKLEEAI